MVTSDWTIRRALWWLDAEQSNAFARCLVDHLERRGMLLKRFVKGRPTRGVVVVDGSCMSGHWISRACLTAGIAARIIRLSESRRKSGNTRT